MSGAAVAVTVPYINARLERAKLRFQTQAARLDELRATFDEGVVALSLAESAIETAEPSVERAQQTEATASACDAAADAIAKLREAVDRVDRDCLLLAVRLGSRSDVVDDFDAARIILRELEQELADILAAGPPSDDPAVYGEATQALAQLREDYSQRKRRFLDSASFIVGPDTSGAPRGSGKARAWLRPGGRRGN